MIQDVYNLGSFIMFLGVRRNPQTNTCPLKAIKQERQEQEATARDLFVYCFVCHKSYKAKKKNLII